MSATYRSAMTYTDRDMIEDVTRSLDGWEGGYDVQGIVDDLQQRYGTVDPGEVPAEAYWEIVHNRADAA